MTVHIASATPPEFIDELPDIEIADLKAKASESQIDDLIRDVQLLAEEEGVIDCVGLCVLHKHHADTGEKILVRNISGNSMSVSFEDMDENSIPASWMLVKDEEDSTVLLPTEWAKDSRAKDQLKRLQDSKFFEKFSERLFDSKLDELIGLTLSWADELGVQEDEILVEQTDIDDSEVFQANVVTPEKVGTFDDQDLVTTNWFFGENKSCRCGRGPSYCVRWTTVCVRRSPGHSVVRRCSARRVEHMRQCTG